MQIDALPSGGLSWSVFNTPCFKFGSKTVGVIVFSPGGINNFTSVGWGEQKNPELLSSRGQVLGREGDSERGGACGALGEGRM